MPTEFPVAGENNGFAACRDRQTYAKCQRGRGGVGTVRITATTEPPPRPGPGLAFVCVVLCCVSFALG